MREEHTSRISGLGRPLGLFRSGQTFVADCVIIVMQHLAGEKSVNFLTTIETIRILVAAVRHIRWCCFIHQKLLRLLGRFYIWQGIHACGTGVH
jgi:hypothetical protein